MKKMGLFLVVCLLLCTLGNQSASAQEPEEWFIPLLTEDYDTSLPRREISAANFERLLPQLMEAMENGLIKDFKPDFYGGFVRITDPSEALLSSGDFPHIFTSRVEAIVKPQVEEMKATGRSSSFSFWTEVDSSCFTISNAGDSAHLIGTLKSPTGVLLGVLDDYANTSGFLYDCWEPYGDAFSLPGYKINIKVFNSSEVLMNTYASTVPRIIVKSANKSTGLVTGTGPAGKVFKANLFHPNLNAAGNVNIENINDTINSAGDWSVDFSQATRGGDSVSIQISASAFFSYELGFRLPKFGCRLWSNYCWINNVPNKPVEMTITHGGTTYQFSGKTGTSGFFAAYVKNTLGDPVFLIPGDKVTGTGVTTAALPNLTLIVSRPSDTVTGNAPANKFFDVGIAIWTPSDFENIWVGSNSSGSYTANFVLDIPTKGTLKPQIMYTNPSTGNDTVYYKLVP